MAQQVALRRLGALCHAWHGLVACLTLSVVHHYCTHVCTFCTALRACQHTQPLGLGTKQLIAAQLSVAAAAPAAEFDVIGAAAEAQGSSGSPLGRVSASNVSTIAVAAHPHKQL